jgi:hypothetical protein
MQNYTSSSNSIVQFYWSLHSKKAKKPKNTSKMKKITKKIKKSVKNRAKAQFSHFFWLSLWFRPFIEGFQSKLMFFLCQNKTLSILLKYMAHWCPKTQAHRILSFHFTDHCTQKRRKNWKTPQKWKKSQRKSKKVWKIALKRDFSHFFWFYLWFHPFIQGFRSKLLFFLCRNKTLSIFAVLKTSWKGLKRDFSHFFWFSLWFFSFLRCFFSFFAFFECNDQ